jgi:uncharacterized protein YyaL (SSP411 family)
MNRLGQQTSPYLRQHADNPVDWYPWGDEAFAAAAARDVPMLLSVGYSSCHWCHVMAHESFENPKVAAVMNELFVNVKIDREERPDVDSVYMEAVQAVNGSGGWPMTVMCLPDGRPFFAGTYFPRERFVDLLQRVGGAWIDNRDGLVTDAAQLAAAVVAGTALPSLGWASDGDREVAASANLLADAASGLVGMVDPDWGGFGRAPKFPQASMLDLLAHAASAGDTAGPSGDPAGGAGPGAGTVAIAARGALVSTLDAMASGGIYDHLGGGFARYATDRRWLIPHFEKMLYDNALLLRTYARTAQLTGYPRYRQVAGEIAEFLLAPPMRQADAGFSSALDADSEGVEGRYYVWDHDEVAELGGPEAVAWYGVTPEGNWEGHNILWRPVRGDLARPAAVEAARRRLLERRGTRIAPGLDDKVLTEWNAMAVAALAEAGAALDKPEWVTAASEVATFLLGNLRRSDDRWLRSWQGGTAQHLGYASDHAWLVEAFTRLAEATGEGHWITEACDAADSLLELFWDRTDGGFLTAGRDAEALIAQPKDTYDGAIPSANSVAAGALLRLAALTGEAAYSEHADALIDAMAPALAKAPRAFSALVVAAQSSRTGFTEVVITGERPDLVGVVRERWRPETVLAWGEPYSSPLWEGRNGPDNSGRAFVCRDYTCRAPVGDPDALRAALDARS